MTRHLGVPPCSLAGRWLQVGALEAIKVKILVRTEGESLKSIKVSQGGKGV